MSRLYIALPCCLKKERKQKEEKEKKTERKERKKRGKSIRRSCWEEKMATDHILFISSSPSTNKLPVIAPIRPPPLSTTSFASLAQHFQQNWICSSVSPYAFFFTLHFIHSLCFFFCLVFKWIIINLLLPGHWFDQVTRHCFVLFFSCKTNIK